MKTIASCIQFQVSANQSTLYHFETPLINVSIGENKKLYVARQLFFINLNNNMDKRIDACHGWGWFVVTPWSLKI
jgi:hypothetical protein